MFKFIEKHPFISGVIVGVIVVGKIEKRLKKIFKSQITVIKVDLHDIPKNNLTFGETSTGEDKPKVQEEN